MKILSIFLSGVFKNKMSWYPKIIYYQRAPKASLDFYKLVQSYANFSQLFIFPTTFCQLLLANYHSSLNWSNLKSFLYATKKKNFLWSLKIIIWSSLLYFRLCLCVRTFYCIMEKVPLWNIFLIFFVTDHYIKL